MQRPDDYASVAFWYQSEPHKPFGSVPPVDERLYYSVEQLTALTLSSIVAQRGGQATMIMGQRGAGKDVLYFAAEGANAMLEVEFEVSRAGKHQVAVFLPQGPQYGNYQVYLNDEAQGSWRTLYSEAPYSPAARVIGTFELAPGRKHRLRFECLGKLPASRGYDIAVGPISLTPR